MIRIKDIVEKEEKIKKTLGETEAKSNWFQVAVTIGNHFFEIWKKVFP